ncbi:hypothetical protein GCM10009641_45150 [Mycobacterium cookii]|uniref:Uncharacterized protein n=1 Tax=Nocardioides furvisabuli TaxID=375542 RepID=A0ABP5JD75_9ACTN
MRNTRGRRNAVRHEAAAFRGAARRNPCSELPLVHGSPQEATGGPQRTCSGATLPPWVAPLLCIPGLPASGASRDATVGA